MHQGKKKSTGRFLGRKKNWFIVFILLKINLLVVFSRFTVPDIINQSLALALSINNKQLEKAAKEELQAAALRDLKLPAVKSYALCDEPYEVAECKAFVI